MGTMDTPRPSTWWTGLAVAFLLVVLGGNSAHAHGPCHSWCLSIRHGPPGATVTIERTTAYKIVWNPDLEPFVSLWLQSHRALYHPKQATRTLVSLPRPRERVRFKVPDVPSGRYVMIIYDGSEGGSHYTYARFIVEKAPRSRTHPTALPFTGAPTTAILSLAALFLAAVGLLLIHRSREPFAQETRGAITSPKQARMSRSR